MNQYCQVIKKALEKKSKLERKSKEKLENALCSKEKKLIEQFIKEYELVLDSALFKAVNKIDCAAETLIKICLQEVLDFQRDSYAYDLLSEWIASDQNPFILFQKEIEVFGLLKSQSEQLSLAAKQNYEYRKSMILYRGVAHPQSHCDFILKNFVQVFTQKLRLIIQDQTIEFDLDTYCNTNTKKTNAYSTCCIYVRFFSK